LFSLYFRHQPCLQFDELVVFCFSLGPSPLKVNFVSGLNWLGQMIRHNAKPRARTRSASRPRLNNRSLIVSSHSFDTIIPLRSQSFAVDSGMFGNINHLMGCQVRVKLVHSIEAA